MAGPGPVRARGSRSGPVRSGLPRSMCCGSRPVKMPPAFFRMTPYRHHRTLRCQLDGNLCLQYVTQTFVSMNHCCDVAGQILSSSKRGFNRSTMSICTQQLWRWSMMPFYYWRPRKISSALTQDLTLLLHQLIQLVDMNPVHQQIILLCRGIINVLPAILGTDCLSCTMRPWTIFVFDDELSDRMVWGMAADRNWMWKPVQRANAENFSMDVSQWQTDLPSQTDNAHCWSRGKSVAARIQFLWSCHGFALFRLSFGFWFLFNLPFLGSIDTALAFLRGDLSVGLKWL